MAETNSLKQYLQNPAGADATDQVRRMNASQDNSSKAMAGVAEVIHKSNVSLAHTIVDSIQSLITISSEKLDSLVESIKDLPHRLIMQQELGTAANAERIRENRQKQKPDSMISIFKEILKTLKESRPSKGLGLAPVILTVSAIVGFFAGAAWTKFVTSIKFLWESIKFVSKIFSKDLPLRIEKFFTETKATWIKKIGDILKAIKTGLSARLARLFGPTTKIGKIGKIIGSIFKWFGTKLFPTFLRLSKTLGGFIGKFFKIFGKGLKLGSKLLKGIPVIGQIIGGIIDIFTGLWAAFKEWKAGGSIKDIIVAFFAGFVSSFTFGLLKVDKLKEWFGKFVDWIIDASIWTWEEVIKPAWEWLSNTAIETWDALVWTWENAIKPAIDWLGEVFQRTWDGLNKIWDNIVFFFEDMGRLFSGEESFIVKALKDTFFGWIDNLKAILDTVANSVMNVYKAFIRKIIDLMPFGTDRFVPQAIKDWVGYDEADTVKKQDKVIESAVNDYVKSENKKGNHISKEEKSKLIEKAKSESVVREGILNNLVDSSDSKETVIEKEKNTEQFITLAKNLSASGSTLNQPLLPLATMAPSSTPSIPANVITDTEIQTQQSRSDSSNKAVVTNSGNTTVVDNRSNAFVNKNEVGLVTPTSARDSAQPHRVTDWNRTY